jgi:hypothetical protein
VQRGSVIRNNYLIFRGLAELSALNTHYLFIFIGEGNTRFYPPDCGKNICFDGFFLTGKFWGKL